MMLNDADIVQYDLNPDESITDHDAVCIAQAGKLLQIGYLEYETAVYGTVYHKNGERHYYISAKENRITQFMHQCYNQNIYPAPVKYFFKRYDLVNQTEEEVQHQFRLEVARKLRATYPPVFFTALDELTKPLAANSAFGLMKELCEQLDSSFDFHQLQLFDSLAHRLLQGRLLTQEGYWLLKQWLDKEYEKIAVEPVASGDYRRTYAGFAYQKPDGSIAYFCDAFPYMSMEKQRLFLCKGYLVTPVLTVTYYADSFQHLENSRQTFDNALRTYLGERYLKLMAILRTLPASVDVKRYRDYLEQITAAGSATALEAFRYYGYLWNVL